MRRGLVILGIALLAGVVGYVASRRLPLAGGMDAPHEGGTRLPELEWLRRDLNLTDDQFSRVSQLHLAYRPTCAELCARVRASHRKIEELVDANRKVTPELQAALEEHTDLHLECQKAMLGHLYATAACLSEEQAGRYLSAMLPQVIALPLEPDGPPGGY